MMLKLQLSPDGSKMVFTSMRSGDLELYLMDTDGFKCSFKLRMNLDTTVELFFSPDGKKLVFRSSRPKTPEENLRSILHSYL